MPNIETETTYNVELAEDEQDRIQRGETVTISLPDGDIIRLSGGGTNAVTEDDTDLDDIEDIVTEAQAEDPAKGADTGTPDSEGENPHAGGIIDVERNSE